MDIASLVFAAIGFGVLVNGLRVVEERVGHGIAVSFWMAMALGALGGLVSMAGVT